MMTSYRRHIVATIFSVALAGGVSLAQQKPPVAAGERPQGLSVDFTVLAADGSPITDLTAAEVSVRLNGKARTIQSLRLMRVGDNANPAAATPTPSALPPPYGANTRTSASAARRVMFVVDTDSFRTGTEGPLRQAINGLIASVSPNDRLLLATLPYGGVMVPFTTDHNRIRTAISTMAGQRAQSETGSEMACRTRRVLESLAGLLDTAPRDGAPVTVVFFTAGMAGPRRDALTGLAPGMCELRTTVFQNVGTAAAAARATFYVVHPDDIRGNSNNLGQGNIGSDNPLEGIESLSGVTGASRLPLLGVGSAALAPVARETGSYYVAEIEPERADLDGETRKLDVRVSRSGVKVRARPNIAFFTTPPLRPRPSAPTVHQLLLVAEEFAELPMRVSGFTMRGEGDKLKVIGVAETSDPTAVLATAAMALIDKEGRVVAQVTASDAAEIPLAMAMLVGPGTFRLRVAATDTTGRYGTADVEVVADLAKAGPMYLSALTLGLSRHGALTPKLEFGAEPMAIASFEIYGAPSAGMRLSAWIEVARTIDGPAVVTSRLALERGEDDRLVATGAVPIGALPSGDYVVRGVISIEGGETTKIMRTLRKR